MNRHFLHIFVCIFFVFTTGCSALLPSSRQVIKSPWTSFDEAKESFDSITLNVTTKDDLKRLGFDPFAVPNVKILNYLDIIQRFMFNPSIKKEDLDEGIQRCIDAKTKCIAYEINPRVTRSKRHGNFWLDFFNFRRNIKETGWKFEAIIVMVNDVVVYKLWGGNPIIDEGRETKNPLGPLQNASDLFIERALGQ